MTDTSEKKRVKPFAAWLQEQPTGVHGDMSEAMQEAVQACMDAPGKSGKVTLTLTIQVNGGGQVVVKDDVKVTKPKADRGVGLFWADDEGNLERNDPNQLRIPLREVPPGVDARTGEVIG